MKSHISCVISSIYLFIIIYLLHSKAAHDMRHSYKDRKNSRN